jgi:16S rRNA (guanine527-N7)-methyltransferase
MDLSPSPFNGLEAAQRRALEAVLTDGQTRGLLGPGPVGPHIDRALDIAWILRTPPQTALDLGSGGGLPGLPLALAWPATRWILLDGREARAEFLRQAVTKLGLDERVRVVGERAETAGRSELRAAVDVVVARSFGRPAVTAECGSPFLRRGGLLIVAEPPTENDRWPEEGLTQLGMRRGGRATEPSSLQVLVQERLCPVRYPRRVGVPRKRPLF